MNKVFRNLKSIEHITINVKQDKTQDTFYTIIHIALCQNCQKKKEEKTNSVEA